MAYAGIQMFMEKLNYLINCNQIPSINNHIIIRERPQFQMLYEEFGSMIQTHFIDQHQDLHDLQKVDDLKKKFIYAAEEAQYIVDLFLSGVHIRNSNEDLPTFEEFSTSLNLDDVRRLFKSVKVELKNMIVDSMKMGSSRIPERPIIQSDPVSMSISRNLLGSKKVLDEMTVGLDGDAEIIRDKLVEDQKKVDIVSIVGMGGIGKTTLATKVFNDGYVKHHFYVRAWVTVSQKYDKRDLLSQILASMSVKLDLEKASDSRLREMVHKHLMGKRYLIVIDDIWDIETWDNLKVIFPRDNTRSRILLTTRLTEVATHANSDGLVHHLGFMSKERSWELLCQKVFHGNECPKWSIKHGMHIVENCQGLPLAVVVIAGVLAKEAWNEKFWAEIADKTGSYIVGDETGCMETLGLSYNHLPLHLRECFLYLAGFPEDYTFKVQRLIWLWVAEGFIQKDGNRSLEDVAEGYLMDLIDRNLVTVADRKKFGGAIIACKLHDLVRELCWRKATEERFTFKKDDIVLFSHYSDISTPPYKPFHLFTNTDIFILDFSYPSAQNLRSMLCFRDFRSLSDAVAKCFRSFVLLRVLDLQQCKLNYLPRGVELLVHLKYLAIWNSSAAFPSSICNLWNLQTLIYITSHIKNFVPLLLPSNISDLVNIRHLWSYHPSNRENKRVPFFLPSIERPMNLQSISKVQLGDGVNNFQNCFPYIKNLTCSTLLEKNNDFKSLTCLESLDLTYVSIGDRKNHITFPKTLKSLALVGCRLPWSDISIIQSLPNLEVLKLGYQAFKGSCWNTYEHEFQKLKFLRLELLDIKQWEAYSTSFPSLRQLKIYRCYDLEETPLEIGYIPTLELIKIKFCSHSVCESVRIIQEEQHDLGNYNLKIDIQ